jgi:hypothetical protein
MIRFANDDNAVEPPKAKPADRSGVPVAETPPEAHAAAGKPAKTPAKGRRERAKAPVEDQPAE